MVSVRIVDNGVACTPEDVVRRLTTRVASSSQLPVAFVDNSRAPMSPTRDLKALEGD